MITRKHFYPAVLASAIVASFYVKAGACATTADGETLNITTTTVNNSSEQRLAKTEGFSTKLVNIMEALGSKLYLKNRHLADSSTFPYRLLSIQKNNQWRSAPNHGISLDDLGCYYGVPSYQTPTKFDYNSTPITVESDKVIGDLEKLNDDLIYSGNVVITQADQVITTDKAQYTGKNSDINLSGNTVLHNPEYTVTTKEPVQSNLTSQTIKFTNTSIQMNGSYIRAEAKEHVIDQKENSNVFKDALLTSCPIDDSSWKFSSTEVSIDQDEAFGEFWNGVLWVGPVPIYYFPYARFPITSERQSGILYPSFSLGSDGLSLDLPIYFNLAPNYDWTFTPAWEGEHKWKFDNQFRYMPFENVTGEINFTYLPSDPSWRDNNYANPSGDKRWFFNIKQNMDFLNKDLNVSLDYSRVRPSDYNYLDDIVDENASVTDDHLLQSLAATYTRETIQLKAEARKYQSLIDPRAEVIAPFALMPRLNANYSDTYDKFLFGIDSEISRFEQSEIKNIETFHAVRSHLEPYVKYHVFDQRGTTLDAGARFFYTHYDQSDVNSIPAWDRNYFGYEQGATSKNRSLYLLEMRGKTTFERKVIDMNHTQTLEPEIKYQYIPYENQDDIPLYDTTDRLDDFYTLFSHRRFTGLDRIANLNTLTVGLTSRILDAHDREIMRLSVAQAHSFEPNKVNLKYLNKEEEDARSKLVYTFDTLLFDNLKFHSSGSYDTNENELDAIRSVLRYENNGFLAGISHRFIRDGNIIIGTSTPEDLNQIGGELSIPVANNIKFDAAMYYDTKQNYNIDKKFALRYQDCCFSVALVYEDYMQMNWNSGKHDSDKVIGLQFELKGFYTINVHGIDNPSSTNTHYIPSTDPVNLNR